MARGGAARRGALVVLFGVLIVALSLVAAYSSSTFIPATTSSSTLTLALPGPFSGCPSSTALLSDSTRAILDLTRPSAFQTGYDGQLVGEGGAIQAAELTSLSPETVVYTLNTHLTWSTGRPFGPSDMVAWWHQEQGVPGLVGQGYRDIRSLVVSPSKSQVTALFYARTPFTEWNLLFRDVEAAGAPGGCGVDLLAVRPSLGPYEITSATSTVVTLSANPSWPLNYNRFQHIRVLASDTTHASGQFYVGFSPVVTSSDLGAIAAHSSYASSFVSSPNVLEAAFSPASSLVSSTDVRAGLSWALDRSRLLSRIDPSGGTSSVPTSTLYPPSSPLYPVPDLAPAPSRATPTLSGTGVDCPTCSPGLLARAGWVERGGEWWSRGRRVQLTLGVGPTDIDQRAARAVATTWRRLGVAVTLVTFASDDATARAVATGALPVGIYTRPLGSSPWWVMSSYEHVGGELSYPTGVTTPVLSRVLARVTNDFNPQQAQISWEIFDQWLQRQFWLRPLVTPPALTLWSGRVGNVQPSGSLLGLVDQVTNWGVAPPHAVPTTTTTVRTS